MTYEEMVELADSERYFPVIVRTERQLRRMVKHFMESDAWAWDTETVSLDDRSIVGFSIANSKVGYYVPLGHQEDGNIDLALFSKLMKPLMEHPDKTQICHNSKFDIQVMANNCGIYPVGHGGDVHGGCAVLHDTLTMSWLINVGKQERNGAPYSNGLKENSVRIGLPMVHLQAMVHALKKRLKVRKLPTIDWFPIDELGTYASLDAVATWKLWLHFRDEIEKFKYIRDHYYTYETKFIRVLNGMELEGYQIDAEYLEEAAAQFKSVADSTLKQIHKYVGYELNPNSNKELPKFLYKELGLPVIKLGKKSKITGLQNPSADADVLEELSQRFGGQVAKYGKAIKALPLITKFKNCSKMRSTYCLGVLNKLDSSGRVHCSFGRVDTGRLSCSGPNLQNLPREENTPVSIRQGFIPRSGYALLVLDYSQLELRVLAHYSKSPSMIEAYDMGRDLHSHTAVKILARLGHKVSYEKFVKVTKDVEHELYEEYKAVRSRSKNTTFGIIYGMYIIKLALQLGLSEAEAQEFWDIFHKEYREIEPLIEDTHRFCHNKGYVVTMAHRRRHFSDINDSRGWVRSKAERAAFNCLIQGSAADIASLAMIDIYYDVLPKFPGSRLINQVHDELHIEFPETLDPDKLLKAVSYAMENPTGIPKLLVPLVAEGKIAMNWREAK